MTRTLVLHYLRGITPDVIEEFYPKDGVRIRVSIDEDGQYTVVRTGDNLKAKVRKAYSLNEAADIVVWMSL